LTIGFNYGDDPLIAAQRVIYENKVDETYLEIITEFITRKLSGIPPHSRRMMDSSKMELFLFCLILLFAVLGTYLYTTSQYKKKKKVRKPAPRKSSSSCHRSVEMKRTIFVKLSATMRLNGNQGRKLEGLINKSGVEDIELERKTDQPTVMNKIEASNGVVYVPVHIKGSEEAVQKAVVLIQQAIGKENVDKEIKLPPTRTQRVSTTTAQIPKERKTTSSRSSACMRSCQSLKTIVTNLYQNARSTIKSLSWPSVAVISIAILYAILFCMAYWNFDCMILQRDIPEPYCRPGLYCTIELDTTYTVCRPSQMYRAALVSFVWLLHTTAVVLVLWPIARGIKQMQLSKAEIIIFVSLCCVTLYVAMKDPCKGRDYNSCEQWMDIVMILLFLGVVIILWKRVRPMLILVCESVVDYISRVLRIPFEIYQAKKIKQTIYVKSYKQRISTVSRGERRMRL